MCPFRLVRHSFALSAAQRLNLSKPRVLAHRKILWSSETSGTFVNDGTTPTLLTRHVSSVEPLLIAVDGKAIVHTLKLLEDLIFLKELENEGFPV